MNFRSPTLQLRRTLIVLPPIEIPEPTPLETQETLQSYTRSSQPSSAKPSAISAPAKAIPAPVPVPVPVPAPAKKPLPLPVPPVVLPPLPALPSESYYPPKRAVQSAGSTQSLRNIVLTFPIKKVCRRFWANLPWESVVDGHKVANISWLYRFWILRGNSTTRKKPVAGQLFPVLITTCSVITKPKAPVYKTAPPSNVAAQMPNTAHFFHIRTSNGASGLGDIRVYLNNILLLSFFDSFGVTDLAFTSGGAPIYPPNVYAFITPFAESLVKKTGNIIRLEMDNQVGTGSNFVWADAYGYPKVAGAVVVDAMSILLPIEYRNVEPAVHYKTQWSFNK